LTSHTENDLRVALDRHEISPYFQPLVELCSGRITGFEILARWHRPSGARVSPREFIPLAEQSDLLEPITMQLLEKACAAAQAWPDHIELALNISPRQLRKGILPGKLRQIADAANFRLDRLIVEVTESALVGDTRRVRSTFAELKALGAHLAIDDFGSGYSGLRHLQMLPFDKLKIDAGFIRPMPLRRESRKIVSSVIDLGHSLGLAVVAEGIENQAQRDMLLCLGCEVGQGWLLGRPVPADQATVLLREAGRTLGSVQPIARIAGEVAQRLEALPSECFAQLQALYDGAPVGLGFLDKNLRYVALNQRLADMHGLPVSDHLGRTVAEVVPDLFQRIGPKLHRARAGEVVTDFVSRHHDAALGSERMALASYQPVRDIAGEVIGISVAVVDAMDQPPPISAAHPEAAKPKLAPRQQDVLQLLADGHTVRQIAGQLGVQPGTIKTYISRIYAILGISTRAEAIIRWKSDLARRP
jgi:PAS domain S-box-containing protein